MVEKFFSILSPVSASRKVRQSPLTTVVYNTQSKAIALAPPLTAQVRATATSTFFEDSVDQLTAGTPTFSDPMTNLADKKWIQDSNPQGSCNFTIDGYRVKVNMKSKTEICFAQTTDFSNFVYQVQMQMSQGDASAFLFRGNPIKGTGYVLFLASNGIYTLVADMGTNIQPRTLLQGITIPISPRNIYQFAIVARGDFFSIYINGSYVNSVRDNDTITNSGVIGLGVATSTSNTGDVVYTQVQVWQL